MKEEEIILIKEEKKRTEKLICGKRRGGGETGEETSGRDLLQIWAGNLSISFYPVPGSDAGTGCSAGDVLPGCPVSPIRAYQRPCLAVSGGAEPDV